MSEDGIIAHRIFHGGMTGKRFRAWMRELAGLPKPGDIVNCDNPAAHEVSGVKDILREVDACICFLPPCSPDYNPIEKAIPQMKSFLRKVEATTMETLYAAIGEAVEVVSAGQARNFFIGSGFRLMRWDRVPAAAAPGF